MQKLEQELMVLLLPKDPLDEKNIMLEIRAGTGGDEASIWAGDLLRMYQRYSDTQNWKSAIVNWNPGEAGGYKEVVLEIAGDSVYSKLKYEAGVAPSTPSSVYSKLKCVPGVSHCQTPCQPVP
jgi:peptide chain release factor 1